MHNAAVIFRVRDAIFRRCAQMRRSHEADTPLPMPMKSFELTALLAFILRHEPRGAAGAGYLNDTPRFRMTRHRWPLIDADAMAIEMGDIPLAYTADNAR